MYLNYFKSNILMMYEMLSSQKAYPRFRSYVLKFREVSVRKGEFKQHIFRLIHFAHREQNDTPD